MNSYEITVSHNGKWFFSTREISFKEQARDVYGTLKAKFPESDGYKITVTEWSKSGKRVDF